MNEHEQQLLLHLSEPDDGVRETLSTLKSDLLLIGAGGKIGHALCLMAKRALADLGSSHKAVAVSRFSSKGSREQFEADGIPTIACDVSNDEAVRSLPDASDVIYLVGQKFGTSEGNECMTWLLNAYVPGVVAQRFKDSRIAFYSSGNVYAYVDASSEGPLEDGELGPIGEYAQSVVGRERVFEYFSRANGTPMTCIRLNYANEPRYGVLVDIGAKVHRGEVVDLTQGHANVVWQSDCNRITLRCLDMAASPTAVLNLSGPKVAVKDVAERFGKIFGKTPVFAGEPSPSAMLNNGANCWKRFGQPAVSVDEMIQRIADWIAAGHDTWNKPTHFEVRDGKF